MDVYDCMWTQLKTNRDMWMYMEEYTYIFVVSILYTSAWCPVTALGAHKSVMGIEWWKSLSEIYPYFTAKPTSFL